MNGLRKQVSVVGLSDSCIDVFCTVQAFIGDLYDLGTDVVSRLYILDCLPQLRLLRLVAGEHAHGDRDLVPVEHQGLGDDRGFPVLLGRSLLPVLAGKVNLEVVVGAVEIRGGGVPLVPLRNLGVEELHELLVVLADEVDSVEDLVIAEGIHSVQRWYDLLEGLVLRAGVDDLCIDHRPEEPREVVLELPVLCHDPEVAVDSQVVHHGLEEEVSDVLLDRYGADLGDRPLGFPFVQLVDLALCPGNRVFHAGVLQLRDIAEGFVGLVPLALLGNVESLIDLQVEPLL